MDTVKALPVLVEQLPGTKKPMQQLVCYGVFFPLLSCTG
jgi:hypothetical protein